MFSAMYSQLLHVIRNTSFNSDQISLDRTNEYRMILGMIVRS